MFVSANILYMQMDMRVLCLHPVITAENASEDRCGNEITLSLHVKEEVHRKPHGSLKKYHITLNFSMSRPRDG